MNQTRLISAVFMLLVTLVGMYVQSSSAQDEDEQDLRATIEAQATLIAELEATPASEITLFEIEWSDGLNGWSAPIEWQVVNGTLVNDGTGPDQEVWVVAPFEPQTQDYAVEAEILFINRNRDSVINCVDAGFGLVARGDGQSGYFGGILNLEELCLGGNDFAGIRLGTENSDSLSQTRYTLGDDWHTYRLEVEGNAIRLYIDGRLMAETRDNQLLQAGEVGLWSSAMQIEVRSFKVLAL